MKLKSSRWPAMALILGVAAAAFFSPSELPGQQAKPLAPSGIDFTQSNAFPDVFAPYKSPYVPELNMTNSERLHSLIHDGKLELSMQDALALALENNLDVNIARYSLAYAQTDLLRTKAGGSTRGINPSLFGGVSIFAGGGAGGSGGGTGGAGGVTGGGSAVNTGAGSCCDPSFGVSVGWDQRATPLNTQIVAGVPVVNSHTATVSTFYRQGFLTGTTYTIAVSGNRQWSSSRNQLFNPLVATGLTVGFNQHLLSGFGYRANARFIRMSRNGISTADSSFRQQVMTTVTNVMNLYWDLVVFREDVRVTEKSLALAEKTLSDNKRQVEIGTLAPIEVVRAESEVAARQQDLIIAQTRLQQQQELLKTAISKHVDPDLASAQIDPTDALPAPTTADVPPLDEALKVASANRPEITQAELNIRNQEITIQGARNALLPTLDVFGTYAPTGLSGTQLVNGIEGGFGQSLSQALHGRYPDYSFGFSLSIPIRNRSGQADMATALLQERQLRTQLQQVQNTVAQDVRNAMIAVTQAKAQIEAARKAGTLAQETLDAEQKKFQLGESTVFLVIQAQRDLTQAEVNEVLARSSYAKALTQFNQATGTTLAKNNIELSEAKEGRVSRKPNIPGTPQPPTTNQIP